MKNAPVHIDFPALGKAFKKHVRNKAIKANSTIVYVLNDQLIAEEPGTSGKKVLKAHFYNR